MPNKVWNLHAPEKDEVDVSFDKATDSTKEPYEWWNQKCLTNLDLSSNVLTSISAAIGNLQDLTVLNVSFQWSSLTDCLHLPFSTLVA